MGGKFLYATDPSSMEAMYSEEQALGTDFRTWEDRILEALSPGGSVEEALPAELSWDLIAEMLHRLPPVEQDFLRLYHEVGLRQASIAMLFGCTQAAVSYRLKVARKRLQFLRVMPVLEKDRMDMDLLRLRPQDRRVLWRLYEVTSQSVVAAEMGMSQGKVRGAYLRCVRLMGRWLAEEAQEKGFYARKLRELGRPAKELREADARAEKAVVESKYTPYLRAFALLGDRRWNSLHAVEFPWQDRSARIIVMEEHIDRKHKSHKKK